MFKRNPFEKTVLYVVSWTKDTDLGLFMWKAACTEACPGKFVDFYELYEDGRYYPNMMSKDPTVVSGLFKCGKRKFNKWMKDNKLHVQHEKCGIKFISGEFEVEHED